MLDGTAPENRVAMTAELLIALFVGLSVPVIGAGVALDRGAIAPNTVLGFAILVASVLRMLDGGCSRTGKRALRKSHDERPMISAHKLVLSVYNLDMVFAVRALCT